MKPYIHGVTALVALAAFSTSLTAESLHGRWDAQLTIKDSVIPFRLDLSKKGSDFRATLYNGDIPQTTTRATTGRDGVVLYFDHYLTKITAKETNGVLEGKVEGRFSADEYITAVPFSAKRYQPPVLVAADAPVIEGLWEIPYESPKGEKAWRFIVKQTGPDVSAAILRVDGDTGSLTGAYRDGVFVLSHFDGSRPLRLEVTPKADGTLGLRLSGAYTPQKDLVALRPEAARAKGFAPPVEFDAHTTVRDPNEKFTFRFPGVDGKVVSSDDPKFRGKVIVAIITGTWCPNCHDEAQYLVPLYKQYRDRGFEIVALDFEEPEQQDELARVKAFTQKYGVEYTYVIAGSPAEMWEKVPQAVNLNTWPATFFVDRSGKVRKIHPGFAAPASGKFHEELKAEFTATIETLLAEKATPETTTSARLER